MRYPWKIAGIVAALGAAAAVAAVLALKQPAISLLRQPAISIEGTVILQDDDPTKESPIAGVSVAVEPDDGVSLVDTATSDFSGYFKLRLPPTIVYGDSVTLRLRHPDHQPIDLVVPVAEHLYVMRMSSAHPEVQPRPARPDIVLSEIIVRYTIESRTALNIGSGARPSTCPIVAMSRAIGSRRVHLMASGRRRTAVCRSTPERATSFAMRACPASLVHARLRISSRMDFRAAARSSRPRSATGRTRPRSRLKPKCSGLRTPIRLSVPTQSSSDTGSTLHWPPPPRGVSIEAEVDGEPIIFPLAPNGILSWATCNVRIQKEQARLYRCELKPGYIFKNRDGEEPR